MPDLRAFSTSVENCVNENNFIRIYVQGVIIVKSETGNSDENVVKGENNRVENDVREKEYLKFVEVGKQEREVAKETWKLLRNGMVTYSGSLVGTVATSAPHRGD